MAIIENFSWVINFFRLWAIYFTKKINLRAWWAFPNVLRRKMVFISSITITFWVKDWMSQYFPLWRNLLDTAFLNLIFSFTIWLLVKPLFFVNTKVFSQYKIIISAEDTRGKILIGTGKLVVMIYLCESWIRRGRLVSVRLF